MVYFVMAIYGVSLAFDISRVCGIGEASYARVVRVFTHDFQSVTFDDSDALAHRIHAAKVRHHQIPAPSGIDDCSQSTVEFAPVGASALHEITKSAFLLA